MRTITFLFAVGLAALLSACGTSHQTSECSALKLQASEAGDAEALVRAGDEAFAKRKDVAQLKAAIAAWAKALRIDPKRAEVRVKLSRARYLHADFWLRQSEDDDAEEKMMVELDQGVTDAETALRQLSKPYLETRCKAEAGNLQEAIKKVDKAGIGAMYWYASNLGKWGLAKGLFTILKYKDDIKAMQDRILELEPGFFYHAPYRYMGVYHIKVPPLVGAPEKSKPNFEAAVKGSPQYLESKVLYASYYATKVKDRQLFRELLKDVLEFDLSKAPDIEAENIIAQTRAKSLFEDIDDYFGEPDEAQTALDKKADAAREAKKKAEAAAVAPAAAPAAEPAPAVEKEGADADSE